MLTRTMLVLAAVTSMTLVGCASRPQTSTGAEQADSFHLMETEFRDVPMAARRHTSPLFWLHGDESKECLEQFVAKVAEGHNGGFVTESRPHNDWLGEGWFRDLDICLAAAKQHDLKMWIFDEKWWPSQTVGGHVPEQYRAKRLAAEMRDVPAGQPFVIDAVPSNLVAIVAGQAAPMGIDPQSLVDLTTQVRDSRLHWQAPAGNWRVMIFTHVMAPPAGQSGQYTVDGASAECVNWFIQKVYEPHYQRYKADFGKTIAGYFYDEPEIRGDWGTELPKTLSERGVDYLRALVAWKFRLSEQQTAYRYAYLDAFLETWGRTMYGGMERWCAARGVKSIGHFMEHSKLYMNWGSYGPGNMQQVQKYSSMGGIDLVVGQLRIGKRWGVDGEIFQMPKLASSISHVQGKQDDLAMCEIFGAYGQDLGYYEMKWLADQQQVRGVNFMVPHSFDPRAPYDQDCPPYFYMDQYEPRWPLYRIWSDYNNRLSLLLTGGRHVCPVAMVTCGNSIHVGQAELPDTLATALQDVLLDNDWLTYENIEQDATIDGRVLQLHGERYRVLVLPPAEVIPWGVMKKAVAFYQAGGVVVGYGIAPTRSATPGHTDDEILALRTTLWGDAPMEPSLAVRRTSPGGGRSYFLPMKPAPEQLKQVLVDDARIQRGLEVIQGKTEHWVQVLHRQKQGRDIFFIANQNHQGDARHFVFRAAARGWPELWNPMTGEVTALTYHPSSEGEGGTFELTLQPNQGVLVVFQPERIPRPEPVEREKAIGSLPVARTNQPSDRRPIVPPGRPGALSLMGSKWIWYPEGQPNVNVPAGTCCFRKVFELPRDRKIVSAKAKFAADNAFELTVNGKPAGKGDDWAKPTEINLAGKLAPGTNTLAVTAINGVGPVNPAGLVGVVQVRFESGEPVMVGTDASWKVVRDKPAGDWQSAGFDDAAWVRALAAASYGDRPWGGREMMTLSPTGPDPFVGTFELPKGWDPSRLRICLEMTDTPDHCASVQVNGQFAGGTLGEPARVDISQQVKPGQNQVRVEPLAPKGVRLVAYPR